MADVECDYQIRKSSPGFVVWSGWHGVSRLPSGLTHKDIVGYGVSEEAAKAIVRLFETVQRSKEGA